MSVCIPLSSCSNIPNDQSGTQRILSNPRSHQPIRKIDILRLLVLRKTREVLRHEDAIVHAPAQFSHEGLEGRLAEILFACFLDELRVVLQPVFCVSLLYPEL